MKKIFIINLFDKKRRIYRKKKIKGYDSDFWEPIFVEDLDPDVEEAIEEYVRDCDDVSEWVNWYATCYDWYLYFVWLDWYSFIW